MSVTMTLLTNLTNKPRCRKWAKRGRMGVCLWAAGMWTWRNVVLEKSREFCKSPSKTQEIAWLLMGYNVTGRQGEHGDECQGNQCQDLLGSSCSRTEPGAWPMMDGLYSQVMSVITSDTIRSDENYTEWLQSFLGAFPLHITMTQKQQQLWSSPR